MVDLDRLSAAYRTARCDLLAEASAGGRWLGELPSSCFASAVALSALTTVERHAPTLRGRLVDERRECQFDELIVRGLHWLADRQNADGGWSVGERGASSLAATMVVRATFALTCVPADHAGMLDSADAYIKAQGGVRGLRRRHRDDKPLVAAVLSHYALAGLTRWSSVPALPFEWAGFPKMLQGVLRRLGAPYALPILVTVGPARYAHRKPWNPIAWLARRLTLDRALGIADAEVPADGGTFDAPPLAALIAMSLVSAGKPEHPAVRRGVQFLLDTVRRDSSWPMLRNLSTRHTSEAIAALAAAGEDLHELAGARELIATQRRQGAAAAGWSWTERGDCPSDIDDTASALVALRALPTDCDSVAAATSGVRWLLALQNADGGWPLFARGAGQAWFDRSGAAHTAGALRGLAAWRGRLALSDGQSAGELDAQVATAIERGFRYLSSARQGDGFWSLAAVDPSQSARAPRSLATTCQVLAAYRDANRLDAAEAHSALDWLVANRRPDGAWAEPRAGLPACKATPTIEATALASETLLTCGESAAECDAALAGIAWLVDAVEANRHHLAADCAAENPWRDERLVVLVRLVAALGRAASRSLVASAAAVAEPAKS